MSRRSTVIRWVVLFLLGILLTPLAAFGGTLGAMALGGMSYCFTTISSMSCTDFLATGLFFGTMFAAPCTMLLIPLFYTFWGSDLRFVLFAFICAVLGLATMQGWETLFLMINPRQLRLPGLNPLLFAGFFGGFVFGIAYRPIMRFIDCRLSPRLGAEDAGAAI